MPVSRHSWKRSLLSVSPSAKGAYEVRCDPQMPLTDFGAIQPLQPGTRVALVAPAGVLRHEEDLNRALDNVRSLGWTPVVGPNIRSQLGYLAGSDAERLQDINAAFATDELDAVWCVRAGYGSMRLLAALDYDA